MPENWRKLIVALDLEDKQKIRRIVDILSPQGVKFKIGSIAFTKFGPELVKEFINKGIDIFLDLKLYDIPNTMKKTAKVITEMSCWAFTIHLQAGEEALRSVKSVVVDTAKRTSLSRPLILGVSVLTTSQVAQDEVNNLVKQAQSAGLDGVIASAGDAKGIKKGFPGLKVVTPGIRNPADAAGDQLRIATASRAFANGADYIVVGRPIVERKDYLKAAEHILEG